MCFELLVIDVFDPFRELIHRRATGSIVEATDASFEHPFGRFGTALAGLDGKALALMAHDSPPPQSMDQPCHHAYRQTMTIPKNEPMTAMARAWGQTAQKPASSKAVPRIRPASAQIAPADRFLPP